MRFRITAGAGLLLLFALACADSPAEPDAVAVAAPTLDHRDDGATELEDWRPGTCSSSHAYPLSYAHDPADAEAADENGNGIVCIFDYEAVEESYADDAFQCGTGESVVFLGVEGHPIDHPVSEYDPMYDAVICVDQSSGIAFDDCTTDTRSGDTGDGGTIGGGDGDDGDGGGITLPGLGDPSTTAIAADHDGPRTCDRPEEFDDFEDALCPDGFGAPFPYDHEADANGNGLVCWTDGTFADDVVGLELTAGRVNGHGVYDTDGATLSFSFHARSDGDAVRGNFEFHDRSDGTTYHGSVTCLEAHDETVHLEGVISNAKRNSAPEGTVVSWTAVDNGEGKNAPADRVSAPETFGAFSEACSVRPTNPAAAIRGGNIQVK